MIDENSAIGGFKADIDAIKKKLENGEKITQDDICAISKEMSGADFIWLAVLFSLFCDGWGGNSSADYWRGKYDAYKELNEKKESRPS